VVSLAFTLALLSGCERRRTEGASPPSSATPRAPTASASNPLSKVRWDDTPVDWSRPLPVTPAGGLSEPGYVGSEACRTCHTGVYDSYARHSMARTGMRPLASLDQRDLARIFDQGKDTLVRHEKSGYAYRPVRRKDGYYIEEVLFAADGSRLSSWMQPITHSLSAGSYGMAFFFRMGERLYHAPIDHFAKLGRWDLDPAAGGGNPRFSTALGSFCISCHSDYPRRLAAVDDAFLDPLPAGVGCERCHGPGERHAKSAKKEDVANPARLSSARQLDVCTQCHQSGLTGQRQGRHQLSYRPGEPLDAFRINHVSTVAEPDRFNLLSHPDRLTRSACFTRSKGALLCTTCHDPHRSSFDQPATYWDGKCNGCHAEKPCTADVAMRRAEGDHCVHCHMRSGPTADVPLVSVTDHFIQRRPPPVRPGRMEKPEELVPFSPLGGGPSPGEDLPALLAVAYGQAGRPEKATPLFASSLEADPRVPGLMDWVAERVTESRQTRNLPRVHRKLLAMQPDAPAVLVAYARALLDVGTPDAMAEATRALARAVAVDPGHPGALETRGMLAFRSGAVEEARPLFERAVMAAPAMGPSHVGLAVLEARAQRSREATLHFEAARRAEPMDAWILDRLSDLYGKSKDAARAREIEEIRRKLAGSETQQRPTPATGWLPASWR
jgi:Tfp pilus assembly protein PilF